MATGQEVRNQVPADPGVIEVGQGSFEPSGVLLAVSGELDLYTTPTLREAVQAAVKTGAQRILIDLTGVTFVDSVSMAVFITANRELEAGRRMALVVDPDSYAMLIFEVCGMRSVLEMFDTREQGLAALRS